jgi:GNAT superfamily N-acetyltransferase
VSDAPAPSPAASPPRPVRDGDAPGLVDLVGAAFAEHPGCVLDLDDLDADLLAPATVAGAAGARWWVLDAAAGGLAATIGAGPPTDGVVELKRLYVALAARRQGLGEQLVRRVEAHAAGLGAHTVALWSDTRFADAHRLYARLGYVDTGETRELHDPSATTERHFRRRLAPHEPTHRLTWEGPHGPDRCAWSALPDGARLAGEVAGTAYDVEVDAGWRIRRLDVVRAGRRCRVTSDGDGRWWVDGVPRADLDGAVTADVEATPATTTLVVRAGLTGAIPMVRVRVPSLEVVPARPRYDRLASGRWRYRSSSADAELVVDDDGLVETYGPWRRRGG